MCLAGILDAMWTKGLPASVRLVWQCLENHAGDNRRWSMSLDRIVAEIGLSIETVTKAVRILQDRGIVRGEREGYGNKATLWHMLRSYPNGVEKPPDLKRQNCASQQKPGMEKPNPAKTNHAKPDHAAKTGDGTPNFAGFPPAPPLLNPPEYTKGAPLTPHRQAALGGTPPLRGRDPYAPNGFDYNGRTRAANTNPRALGTNPRGRPFPRHMSGCMQVLLEDGFETIDLGRSST